jgi:hypothetical protein
MTDPRDPTRLRDLDPLLREAFDTVRSEQPSSATVEAMIRAVEQATLGPAIPGEPLSTSSVTKFALLKSQVAKLIVIAGVSSGLLWTLPSLRTPASDGASPAPASPAAPVPSSSSSQRVSPAADERTPPRDARIEPATSERRSRMERETSVHVRKPAPSRPRDAQRSVAVQNVATRSDALPASDDVVLDPAHKPDRDRSASEPRPAEPVRPIDELTLLEEAQRALRSSPQRALELTAQHEREYPNGAYLQEREQIAIEALFGAGRISAMRARAERFRRAFPGSAHNARITELLELQR